MRSAARGLTASRSPAAHRGTTYTTIEKDDARSDAAASYAAHSTDHADNALKAKHLDRAYEIWNKAHFNDGVDRALNITRMHDLLGMESGACDWPDDAFLGEELPD